MPYEESLKLLKNTANVVDLTVSQIFSEYQRKLQHQHQHHSQHHLSSLANSHTYENNPSRTKTTSAHSNSVDGNQRRLAHINSHSTYVNERTINNNDNDNDRSCLMHDDYDNNNHDRTTVLITKQLSKIACDAPNLANSYSHCTDTKSFTKHGFNDNSKSSEALNCSRREFSDNCLVSANCMPDLPKVNLQLS